MKEVGYLLQAVLVLAWWMGLTTSDKFFDAFQFPNITRTAFNSFFLPDVLAIVTLSLARVYKFNLHLQFVILGAFLYATLFCVNASMMTNGGYLPTTMMLLGLGFNYLLCFDQRLFRNARPSNMFANALKTLIQIVSIWFVALFAIPCLLLRSFGYSVVPVSGAHLWLGVTLFAICSVLGLWSAYVIVRFGDGTPLPLDQANRLVTQGPYQLVRNPMAVAGVGQGISVAIAYLSVPILIYSILGAIVWQVVVKPIEERDLEARFGESYDEYRNRVGCWIPSWNRRIA